MSYSFSVRAATKAAALAKIVAELDKVVAAQPVHAADRPQAQAAAEAFVGLLPVDESRDVNVSVNGSISISDGAVVGSSIGVYASNISKATPQ